MLTFITKNVYIVSQSTDSKGVNGINLFKNQGAERMHLMGEKTKRALKKKFLADLSKMLENDAIYAALECKMDAQNQNDDEIVTRVEGEMKSRTLCLAKDLLCRQEYSEILDVLDDLKMWL